MPYPLLTISRLPQRIAAATVVWSEKLVAAGAESASALTLQETDISALMESLNTASLDESITFSPGTVPYNTIGSSLSCEKFVAVSSDSSSTADRDVSSSEELLDATSTEEPIIAGPQAEPHDPVDGSSNTFPFRCEKLLASAVESASMSPEGLSTASPQSMLDKTTDGYPPSASSLRSKILTRSPRNWYQVFYIRMNRWGSFCMYPNLGGPFPSIDEADEAIDRYLDELRHQAGCKELAKLSYVERRIHNCKYYLDGTPKRGPNKPKGDYKLYLLQALLHKYNEDHNLFGHHAHELEALVGQQWICENHRWYYHFNFTIKQNEGNDNSSTSNLFFAEVSHMQGEKAWEVNCCCMIKHDENGHCYGCRNNGSPDMKHPDNIGAYYGGHLDGYLPFGLVEESSGDDEEAEEARLRAKFEGLDDPKVWEKLLSLTRKIKVERPRQYAAEW